MKYSINSAGRIVAERDIYSLGGFIPKGRLGGFIADKTQLSQDGECWLAGGDISGRPDVRIKDNAYIGDFFINEQAIHTDGITEFSGNTLIPGYITIRSFATFIKNNVFVKDSFIGVSMDVLCGPSTTTTAFPFGQGIYSNDAAKGTLFENMAVTPIPVNICRSLADLRLGKDTYLYIPTGYNCRVLWAYYDTSDRLAYSGESTAFAAGLHKLSHPVYKVARMHIAKVNGTAMTPTDLLATGAKILGHISNSRLMDIRPESASGRYVMDKSSILMNTDDYGLAITQMRLLAGSMYDTTMYTKTDRSEYKLYGTFRNVERLEYTKYLRDSHRTAATRDTYISAYDCPLLRVDDNTYDDSLAAKGGLVLRRCIVPKAEFQDDVINGNTYEDVDFSFTNEDLGFTMAGYTRFLSSHKQGIYRLSGGSSPVGFVSHKGNLADTARLFQELENIPLDGNIMEQGEYTATVGTYYEDSKNTAAIRVRTRKPLPTFGAAFPTPPAGFKVTLIAYLGEDFKIQPSQVNPTTIETEYPYFVAVFGKADDSAITVTDFIALNSTLRMIDHTKAPEITGSAYVGAGCTVRGDVQLTGDPYVNRVLDVNMWERGTNSPSVGKPWEDSKVPTTLGDRFRLMDTFPVEPGGLITCNSGYWVKCYFYDANGNYLSSPEWGQTANTAPDNAAFAGAILKKGVSVNDSSYIEDSDIPLANVKYVRAFKKRRYITNELDRTSPEDILLGPGFFEQGGISIAEGNAGKPYEDLKIASPYRIRLKRPFGLGAGYRVTFSSVYSFGTSYYDAVTKLLYGSTSANMDNSLLSLVGSIADSPTAAITPADVTAARVVIEFTPTPRIIVPYGSDTLLISGPKIRMYDNAVLSRNFNQEGEIVLQGDAVMGYDFNSGSCMCSNGHSDAIIKQP